MLVYKIDVIKALKNAGYNSTRLRNEGLIAQATLQNIRYGKMVGISTLEQICNLLDLQPGDIIENVKEPVKETVFEIIKNTGEYSWRQKKDIHTGCTFDQDNQSPETVERHPSKKDALEALKKYSSDIRKYSGNAGALYLVTEYAVQENVYDEDGDWVEGGNIWEFAALPEIDF